MSGPITTGSGIERTVNCPASAVLPRVYAASSVYAARGTEAHGYLERISNGLENAESLLLVAEEHRPACEAIDLPPLAPDLKLSAEVAFAYNPVTDTARVLGQSLERDYSSITEDEWPLTIDLAGVDPEAAHVRDWKTGWSKLARTGSNWQMRGAAIAIARAFDRDRVEAQLIYLRGGRPAWRDRAGFDAFELASIAAELRQVHERVRADRAAFARGEDVPPSEGPWCRYCPSMASCPAKIGLIRWAVTGVGEVATTVDLGEAWRRVQAGKKALELVEKQMLKLAEDEPMLLEVLPDGTEVWLGAHQKEGNEKLDAAIAVDVAMDVLSVPADQRPAFTAEVTTITKAALERASKQRVASGQAAGAMRTITDAIRARGGVTRPTSEAVGIYTIKPRALGAGGQ